MTINCVVQLLDWSETKRGQKIVIEIMGGTDGQPFEEHPFKVYTSREGKKAGQLFGCAFVLLNDNAEAAEEIPAPITRAPFKRSQLAFVLCKDETFWNYVNREIEGAPTCSDELSAKLWFLEQFGIESRSELDKPENAEDFDHLVRQFEAFRDDVYRARI